MRLIDADEFRKRIDHYPPEIRIIAKKELRYVKTIDAVEVIRCKDCKHRLHLEATGVYPAEYKCRLDDRTFYPSRKANDPEWFCADGERKTNENDN